MTEIKMNWDIFRLGDLRLEMKRIEKEITRLQELLKKYEERYEERVDMALGE